MNIRKKLHEIFQKVIKFQLVDKIEENNLIEAYGINSVDALEILIMVEREFNITIDDEDLNQDLISSFEILEKYIVKRQQETLAEA